MDFRIYFLTNVKIVEFAIKPVYCIPPHLKFVAAITRGN